ncbi:MAG: tetratricopeptide repeat protein [Gammaproteobacteria bacterium]|nr:tetratricopeptide repeat protein [Gammaproteobacteria bacterium]MCD8541947.1 tetratricopeptide repeat protein [Gammaproteobacteria bacterium]MCD8573734.1 tetratricopeptide repeat protein [Gammaproteobacteria bacterium]
MTHVYKTEEEQIEDLKRWIKSYGPSILAGIVLAIVCLYGWRYWNSYQHDRAVSASTLYQHVVEAYQTNSQDVLATVLSQLQEHYPHSPYTQYALFIQAKISVDAEDYSGADAALSWVVEHTRDRSIESIARLRLGAIQTAEHYEEAAIQTLEKIDQHSFKGLALIKIGDAYHALGNEEKAKQAYMAASQLLPDASNTMPTLGVKLDQSIKS